MSTKLGLTGLTVFDEKLWGNYRATVVANNDPLELGRVKAEVIPYFVGIDPTIIPWAVPKNAAVGGAAPGVGSISIPAVGSKVWVFFEFGDVYQPVYDGEASDGVNGLPSFISTDYPNTRGFQTPSGIKFYIDDTTKTVSVSGATTINISGATTITVSGGTINLIGSTAVNINP